MIDWLKGYLRAVLEATILMFISFIIFLCIIGLILYNPFLAIVFCILLIALALHWANGGWWWS